MAAMRWSLGKGRGGTTNWRPKEEQSRSVGELELKDIVGFFFKWIMGAQISVQVTVLLF